MGFEPATFLLVAKCINHIRYRCAFNVGILITNFNQAKCLTSRSRILEKPTFAQVLKKFPTFYSSRKFILVFTRACSWPLSYSRWIQSIFRSNNFNIILQSTSRISQRSLSFLFPHQNLYWIISPIHTRRPTNLILLGLIILIIFSEEDKLTKIFSSLLLFHASEVHIYFSTSCSQIQPVYALPLMGEAAFSTHKWQILTHDKWNRRNNRPM
jgi:hypothetical protein